MKKILLFVFLMFIMPLSVMANKIYSIDVDVNLNKDGSANITEVWDVDGDNGTEWYKVLNDLGNMELSDFEVYMDNNLLTYKDWNVNESINQKKGYYGINKTYYGLELCFGKGDYKRHKFTLKYNLSNFVFNTSDGQIIYYNFIDKLSDVDFDNFSVTITSYYNFPDTLDVWGYGYKGYAYVSNGKIEMSNEDDMNNKYVVLLAKFPLNTFNTNNTDSKYNTFNDVYNKAEEDTFEYDYGINENKMNLFDIFMILIMFIFPILIVIIAIVYSISSGYGYLNNKKIDKKNTPFFREIPCNKNIYYANALLKLNNFGYKESNIFGAIILKWVKENKISFKNEKKGIFNKNTSSIDLTMNPVFDYEYEKELFDIMYEASKDGILETKEFERWCRSNYTEFFNLFKKIENNKINELKAEGHIFKRENREQCKMKNVLDDIIYEDSKKLYGLKLYLEEFSKINTKEVMEVHLWDEYLMFAYLFGIADKVARQLKDMYPEILEQDMTGSGMLFDYDTLIFVNHISTRSVSAASAARSAAESYSSGGGGFSSGGGGGGSFGGGGGGSR